MALPLLGLGLALLSAPARQGDLAEELAQVKAQVRELAAHGAEIERLKAQFVSFEPRLTQMELDYEALRRSSIAMEARLLILESSGFYRKPMGKAKAKPAAKSDRSKEISTPSPPLGYHS